MVKGGICGTAKVDKKLEPDDANNCDAEARLDMSLLGCQNARYTHNVPTKNIMATPIFFFQCSLRLRICNRGIPSIHASNAMLIDAFAQPIALMLRLY